MTTYKVMACYNEGNKLVRKIIVCSILEIGEAFEIAHALNDEHGEGAIYYVEEE
jgi:hypothetical protein